MKRYSLPEYIREYAEKSLANLGLPSVDLLQFHVWEDDWADDERWQRTMDDLKRQGLIRAVGVSINRWQPANALRTLRTGLIDAVQVIYNIFDQAPEDELFPLCRELNIGVIARVPFDEGSLTGSLTKESHWPAGRLAQYLFRAGKPHSQRRAGRRAQAAYADGHDAAGNGFALYPFQSDCIHRHSRNAQAGERPRQCSGERRRFPAGANSWPSSANTAGTVSRRWSQ